MNKQRNNECKHSQGAPSLYHLCAGPLVYWIVHIREIIPIPGEKNILFKPKTLRHQVWARILKIDVLLMFLKFDAILQKVDQNPLELKTK
jgi:hypothetical protein